MTSVDCRLSEIIALVVMQIKHEKICLQGNVSL